MRMKLEAGGLAAVTLLAAALFFTGLGASPLWDEDETRFGAVAREMRRSGDWIVPRDNGALADKPAGLFWVIAAGFALGGETPASARFGSAVAGVASVVLTWMLGHRLYGQRTAFWGAVATATSLLVVVEARAATADAALLAVITGMLWLAVRVWWRSGEFAAAVLPWRTAAALGVLSGAGILLKGLVAVVVPLFAWAVFLVWAAPAGSVPGWPARWWAAWRAGRFLTIGAVAILVAAPWHIAVGWMTGGEWLELFCGKHHFGRAVRVMEGHGGVPFLQIPWLFAGMFPWSAFLPLALWRTVRAAAHGAAVAKLLVTWSAVWVLLFSLTATQLPNYVLPAYPVLGLCVGRLVAQALEQPETTRNGWLYAAAGGLLLGAAIMAAGALGASIWLDEPALQLLAWLGLLPATGAIGLAAAVAGGYRRSGLVFVMGMVFLLMASIFLLAAPAIARLDPVPGMVARTKHASLATWRYSAPGVVWLAGRNVPVCRSVEEAAEFLRTRGPEAFLLIDAEARDELDRVTSGRVVVLQEGRPVLRTGRVLLVGPP
jgi:4-amino-4-deoxy-L-arabinose transferase-like glycosyltransferase